jgi:hypothetical protein
MNSSSALKRSLGDVSPSSGGGAGIAREDPKYAKIGNLKND